MTIAVKFTPFELELLRIVNTAAEPLTTRHVAARLERRPHSMLGVTNALKRLEREGQLSSSLTLDRLENQWSRR